MFARDRIKGVTERVSVATNGRQAQGNSVLHDRLAISANGRFVAFSSDASNLVRADTNRWPDIFVRDRSRKVTERVSVATNGRQANDLSESPSISSDGRYVAFESYASNLAPRDTNGQRDVFVRDRLKKTTVRVSLTSAGHQLTGGYSVSPGISGNGRYVAFAFVVEANTDPYITTTAILVRDRLRGVTRRVPVPTPSDTGSAVSLSQDGRYVCYENGGSIYIWDQRRNVTRRLPSVGDAISGDSILSADGHHVAFDIPLPTLSPTDENWAAYAWDDVSDALVAPHFR